MSKDEREYLKMIAGREERAKGEREERAEFKREEERANAESEEESAEFERE